MMLFLGFLAGASQRADSWTKAYQQGYEQGLQEQTTNDQLYFQAMGICPWAQRLSTSPLCEFEAKLGPAILYTRHTIQPLKVGPKP